MPIIQFIIDGIREMLRGPKPYWVWLGSLSLIVAFGGWNYLHQFTEGLVVTGMSDQVSWGFYISNFAFLVGIAAAAVLLVIPAYLFYRKDVKEVVLVGEMMAVAAVTMAVLFVLVDLGRPDRIWHMIPVLGRFNWPASLLAWDVVVLNGYLALNLVIPFYLLYSRYRGKTPNHNLYFPLVVLAMFWAISIHTVTAFLFSANSARPFWNTALLGPRFIASAFASGPALIILTLQMVGNTTRLAIQESVIKILAVIMLVALQISVFFVGVELFTDFYNEGDHAASIRYLFLGLGGFDSLQPWIWSALVMNLVALAILMIHKLRENLRWLNVACVLAFVGIWIEKGMGLVIPGFIPTPLGEVFEYTPTAVELAVAAGIWAFGILMFTLLAKVVIAIESDQLTYPDKSHLRGESTSNQGN
jgi:molybdopterin-containing oxidoreductase family membrane subunit